MVESSSDRHENEKIFFNTKEPWSSVTKEKTGIESLRTCPVEILADLIKQEFLKAGPDKVSSRTAPWADAQTVKAGISHKLKLCQCQLKMLGPSCNTRDEQY